MIRWYNCRFDVTALQCSCVFLPALVSLSQFLLSALSWSMSLLSSSSSIPETQQCGEKVNANLGRRSRGA
jgi:hypothetical protein